jgi:hypothetical protein
MPATDPIAILSQGAVRHLLWLPPLGLALPALKVLLAPLLRGPAARPRSRSEPCRTASGPIPCTAIACWGQ